ncbi:hypothetical protein CR513_00495, partial [Mucuna pruriens]
MHKHTYESILRHTPLRSRFTPQCFNGVSMTFSRSSESRTKFELSRSVDIGSGTFISTPEFVTNNCNTNHFDFSEFDSLESKPNILDNQP